MTGYMRSFVDHYSIVAAPRTDILRNLRFQPKRVRKLDIPRDDGQLQAFVKLKEALTSPSVLAYPSWSHVFTLHTDKEVR